MSLYSPNNTFSSGRSGIVADEDRNGWTLLKGLLTGGETTPHIGLEKPAVEEGLPKDEKPRNGGLIADEKPPMAGGIDVPPMGMNVPAPPPIRFGAAGNKPAPPQPEAPAVAPAAGKTTISKRSPSLSVRPGSRSRSVSSSRSYDYSGFDDHIKKQGDVATARDAKKAALYKGDPMSAMLAGNRVRELVNHLRKDAPGTSEENPYQLKTPFTRVSSESNSSSSSNSGGSREYEAGGTDINMPANGGRRAAGQQEPAANPLPAPPAFVTPPVVDAPVVNPAPSLRRPKLNPLRRFDERLRGELGLEDEMIA